MASSVDLARDKVTVKLGEWRVILRVERVEWVGKAHDGGPPLSLFAWLSNKLGIPVVASRE